MTVIVKSYIHSHIHSYPPHSCSKKKANSKSQKLTKQDVFRSWSCSSPNVRCSGLHLLRLVPSPQGCPTSEISPNEMYSAHNPGLLLLVSNVVDHILKGWYQLLRTGLFRRSSYRKQYLLKQYVVVFNKNANIP